MNRPQFDGRATDNIGPELAAPVVRHSSSRILVRHPDDPKLAEHRKVSTLIYTYVLNQGRRGVRSPLDQLGPGVGRK